MKTHNQIWNMKWTNSEHKRRTHAPEKSVKIWFEYENLIQFHKHQKDETLEIKKE